MFSIGYGKKSLLYSISLIIEFDKIKKFLAHNPMLFVIEIEIDGWPWYQSSKTYLKENKKI